MSRPLRAIGETHVIRYRGSRDDKHIGIGESEDLNSDRGLAVAEPPATRVIIYVKAGRRRFAFGQASVFYIDGTHSWGRTRAQITDLVRVILCVRVTLPNTLCIVVGSIQVAKEPQPSRSKAATLLQRVQLLQAEAS